MKKLPITFIAFSFITMQLAHADCTVVTNHFSSETRCKLGDLNDHDQKELMNDYIDQVRAEVAKLHIPKTSRREADKLLDQAKLDLNPIMAQTMMYSQQYRYNRGIRPRDAQFEGFFLALGVNTSFDALAGAGGSLLVTFAAVPTQVKSIDLRTGVETDYTDWDTDIGGLLQVGAGLGGGVDVGMRGGLGLIWGDLPSAASVIGSGLAMGSTLDATIGVMGAGVTVLVTKNNVNKKKNGIAFVNLDAKAGAKVEWHGCVFYLLNREEVAKFLHLDSLIAHDPSTDTTTPNLTPSPSPSPGATPADPGKLLLPSGGKLIAK